MSRDERRDLELLFESRTLRKVTPYDYFEEAWKKHEIRLAILEENYRETVFKIKTLDEKIESNTNRFRSVVNTGIVSTSMFLLSIGYLLYIDYIKFEVGVPIIAGITAILIGFLDGRRKNK